ncbi:MAG: GNAT family N-acetyltransferase [Sulfuricellaceae bacterium]|nr:GNAT family N-acetyltransferase [Sulfuricellaceae bacterium]
MSATPFRVRTLDNRIDRKSFTSGTLALDQYFQQQVTQDIRRRVSACFVALTDEDRVAGYYTLATASLLLDDLPTELAKKLPRYPSLPTVRMGRLAVDQDFKAQGLGGALLADALDRCIRSEITAYAMVVDANDDIATSFYLHHGFIGLSEAPQTLFLPLATAKNILSA